MKFNKETGKEVCRYLLHHLFFWIVFYKCRKEKVVLLNYVNHNLKYLLFGPFIQMLFAMLTFLVFGTMLSDSNYAVLFVFYFIFCSFYMVGMVIQTFSLNAQHREYQANERKKEQEKRQREAEERRNREYEEILRRMQEDLERMRFKREQEQHQRQRQYQRSQPPSTSSKLEEWLTILELAVSVRDFKTIQQQYKKLIRTCHPDLVKGFEEKATEVTNAYNGLKEIYKKKQGILF